MAKFSKKIFEKKLNKLYRNIVEGYLMQGGKKDKRSKDPTIADIKRAIKKFEIDVKGKMEANPELSTAEAFTRVQRSRTFDPYRVQRENMYRKLKDFGYKLRAIDDLKYDAKTNRFTVIRGQYKGKTVVIVGPDSQQLMLI